MFMQFAAKAHIIDPGAPVFNLVAAKTMYGGEKIGAGDVIFIFASEKEGGQGLVARGMVTHAAPVVKRIGVARQTPRVNVTIERTSVAKRRLGRAELKKFNDWTDGKPETELNFKLYRQATNKIIGITESAARFLDLSF